MTEETLYEQNKENEELEEVLANPIENSVRFTIMRLVRLVLTVACEAVALAASIGVGIFGFFTCACAFLFIIWFLGNAVTSLVGDPNTWQQFWYYRFLSPMAAHGQNPVLYFMLKHPYLPAVGFFTVLTIFWGQALALGIPYRWKNTPPGLSVVDCEKCGKRIKESLNCSECHAFRLRHVPMRLLWLANVVITSLWVAHDITIGFMGFSSSGK